MIDVICSWCGESWVKSGEIEDNKSTHGICTECAVEYRLKMDRQRREEVPLSND